MTVTTAIDGSCPLGRSCRLAWSGMLCIDRRRPHFISGAAGHRMSSKEQGRQYEHNQRSRASGRCVHPPIVLTSRCDAGVLVSRNSMPLRKIRQLPVPTSTVVVMRIHALSYHMKPLVSPAESSRDLTDFSRSPSWSPPHRLRPNFVLARKKFMPGQAITLLSVVAFLSSCAMHTGRSDDQTINTVPPVPVSVDHDLVYTPSVQREPRLLA